jgi:hypothetical protein
LTFNQLEKVMIASMEVLRQEARVRRMARRQGLALMKSRRRNPEVPDFGGYWLTDPFRNALVFGGDWGASLEEISEYLR